MGQFEFVEQSRQTLVKDSDAVPAGRLRQGAGQPGFTHTTGAGNHQVAFILDPPAGEQLLEERLVQSSARSVIHCLQSGIKSFQRTWRA
jgi:hypothetical protein